MTLIETIIYLALLSILMTGGIASFISMSEIQQTERNAITVESEGSFVLAKIEALVAEAEELDVREDKLRIDTSTESVGIWRSGDAILLRRDGIDAAITSNAVSVSDFSVSIARNVLTVSFTMDGRVFETVIAI